MRHWLFFLTIYLLGFNGYSQNTTALDSLTRTATINHSTEGNTFVFSAQTPELNQIAGAPKAFYTHFWEFGDGHYSIDKEPKHTYKNKGAYEIKLWATNNYDTGKPPTTRPKKIAVTNITDSYEEHASMQEDLTLRRNREPSPNEEMVVVMSYKNPHSYITNGKLYLFYNEEKYKANNFEILESRIYHNEKNIDPNTYVVTNNIDNNNTLLAALNNEIISYSQTEQDSTNKTNLPLTLDDSKSYYKNWNVFEFNDMTPKEERNIFFSLKTTPEMVKDTSAIISVRGVYIPDSNYDNHRVKDMEMEIVTSHDPNKMSSNGAFMSYRLVRFKTLKYKIKFQNNGEGPARTIKLETDIPEMLDKSTLEILDMYPKCDICPKREVLYSCLDTTFTKSKAIFTFKNIYLPGSEQKNVKAYDSTKGFVKYGIKFNKDFHKKKTKSRTAIIFDKNKPIITNYATTRFLPGLSIGLKAGYNLFANLDNSESYFLGATLSPYKSYRWYWQIEFLNNKHQYKTYSFSEFTDYNNPNGMPATEATSIANTYNNMDWDIPILVRYNINKYIGLGFGIQNSISVSEKLDQTKTLEQYMTEPGTDLRFPIAEPTISDTTQNNAFTNYRTSFIFDSTFGFSRIGPSLGARYVLSLKKDFSNLQFYFRCKF